MSTIPKMKLWKGDDITEYCTITFKLDGIRAEVTDGVALSRAGKPLYNLPPLEDGVYEVYLGDWETSMSACRTHNGEEINYGNIYRIDDDIDMNIFYASEQSFSADDIRRVMNFAVNTLGLEGLVIRTPTTWWKVKPEETYDVPVIAIKEGKGRNEGRVGSLITPMGNVGTGLTDKQRDEFMQLPIDTIIEVSCMELTPSGKFRHPRFIRVREDK